MESLLIFGELEDGIELTDWREHCLTFVVSLLVVMKPERSNVSMMSSLTLTKNLCHTKQGQRDHRGALLEPSHLGQDM